MNYSQDQIDALIANATAPLRAEIAKLETEIEYRNGKARASEQMQAIERERAAHAEDLRKLNLQNGVMRTLLENADMAWAQSWDCSAHPGHKVMHHVMPLINEYLTTSQKRNDPRAAYCNCECHLGTGKRIAQGIPCHCCSGKGSFGPNEETCDRCGTPKARGYMCGVCFGPRK